MKDLITANLGTWSTAVTEQAGGRGRSSGNKGAYGINKLRELILELAIRGKLVPQDLKDESANELLERIQAERIRKKKDNPLHAITGDEKPFESPQGWEWVRVGQICHDWGQKTPEKKFTYIEVSAIDSNRGIVSSPEVVKPENAPSRARKIVKKGTVIYSTVRPYLLNIAVIEDEFNPEPIASTAFAIVHPYCAMPPRYFLWFFRSPTFIRYVESVQMGIAYPAINDGQFFSGLLPLPPIEEQHRIVAKVDELMALCDQLETEQANSAAAHEKLVSILLEALTQGDNFTESWAHLHDHFDLLFTTPTAIDKLKQTLLQLAVTGKLVPQDPKDEPASELLIKIRKQKDKLITEGINKKDKALSPNSNEEIPFVLPPGWEWLRLEDISQVGTGATPLRTKSEYFKPATISWVTSGETSNPFIFETKQYVSPLALKETNLTVYPKGTLVIAMYGQGKTRGQITELMIDACTNQACASIQLSNIDEYHRKYVKLFFVKIYDEIRELASGGAQPNLNLSKIKETLIPMPPLKEQQRIVIRVDELMSLCDQLKTKLLEASEQQRKLADLMVEKAVA